MITADPQRRVSTLARILDHVGRTAPDADRDLLLALAPVVYGDMPDPLALRLSPEMISARLAGIFRFVARTMPPAVQLYKGLPGLHVAVRNPDDAEARAEGSTHEVTIVETHSPDAPFVFESLKNYFKKEGLRVFSVDPPDLQRPPPVGAGRLDRRPAGGRLARALLPVPHRARRSPRPRCAASSTRCSRC